MMMMMGSLVRVFAFTTSEMGCFDRFIIILVMLTYALLGPLLPYEYGTGTRALHLRSTNSESASHHGSLLPFHSLSFPTPAHDA